MRGVDTNILVYAHRAECHEHAVARKFLKEALEAGESLALAWPSLYEFVRVVTHPKVFSPCTKLSEALGALETLIEAPSLQVLGPGLDHWRLMHTTLRESQANANVVFDGFIAAVLLEHGVREIVTNDGDFHRFKGLKVLNPFA